ncbi:MAG: glycosyltransferase family 39 protein [Patescibacteria group bacterium]|nr:glycosyltransferase family 39 protein [Patescibacteria group bacterium]
MKEKVILILILILGLVFRLYKIGIPLADHHSWRQSDTAAVARNFVKEGWNFLKPKIDNMTPLHPGTPNNERLFLVEPPIYNSIVAGVYGLFGVEVKYARLVTIFFSLTSLLFLYLIATHFWGEKVGLLTAFFGAVLPYNIYYSRVVLPEAMIICFSLAMFYFAIKWLANGSTLYFVLFTLFSSLSFSQKTFPLFFLLPLAYLIWQKYGFNLFKEKKLYLWFLVAFVPFVLWRFWVGRFPEGIPANLWLFNQGNIRFKGAFFYWIFAKRIGELILGYWGLPLVILGLILKPKKEGWFFHFWLLSLLIFTTVFAAGNVTHDYYQIPWAWVLSVFLAKGANFLLFEKHEDFNRPLCISSFILCTAFALAFSWFQVRDFYNIQSGVDLAGVAVDELTSKDALVLTGDSNDATLLYNTNRWGWTGGYASNYPNEPNVVEQVKQMGASYYVTTKFDRNSEFGKYMLNKYPIVKESDQFILFSLKDDKGR